MINLIKMIKYIIPSGFLDLLHYLRSKNKFPNTFNPIIEGSFSQSCEDIIANAYLNFPQNGLYVDIGANDPDNLSNTKRFYERGWSGINIEPNPQVFTKLKNKRTRDTNLNIGIGKERIILDFYVMADSVFYSFNKDSALATQSRKNRLVSTIKVEIRSLEEVLDECKLTQPIDIMSVDSEGFDLQVLESNNWDKYRPWLIIVEINRDDFRIYDYIISCDYILVFRNDVNGIFLEKSFYEKRLKHSNNL